MIPWYRQKTTWTLGAAILAAIGGYLTGEISLIVCIGTCMGALSGIFMRQGVEKSGLTNHTGTEQTNLGVPPLKDRGVSLNSQQ